MDGYISEEIIEEVRERSDIVETISGFVSLKKTGRNFKGLCPFHSEKTPSFIVSPEKQIFHCFGCGRGGNVFQFLMLFEDFSFPESVKFLASKIGIEIPEKKMHKESSAAAMDKDKEKLFQMNTMALKYFRRLLKESEKAKKYLKNRGMNEASINEFQLGYSSPSWDGLLKYLTGKGVSENLLEKAGLIIKRANKEGYYDRFRDRLIFPIFNLRGEIIGFGGRALDRTDSAKYINSPESKIFQKGKNLFGLNLAKEAIRDENAVLITEGYFDVITARQSGIKNIVATLGTAVTKDHLYKLKRYTKRLYLVFDSDKAGELAVRRVEELFSEEGLRFYVISLPAESDIDSYLRKEGRKGLCEKIKDALPLVEYIIHVTLRGKDFNNIDDKMECINSLMPTMARLNSSVEKDHYISLLAERMRVPIEELHKDFQRKDPSRIKSPVRHKEEPGLPSLEAEVVRLLLANPVYLEKRMKRIQEVISPSEFKDNRLAEIISLAYEIYNEKGNIFLNGLIDRLPSEMAGLARKLGLEGEIRYGDDERIWNQAMDDCIKRTIDKDIKIQIKEINIKMREAEKKGEVVEINKLQRELMSLYKENLK